jgi:hypothetical protein
MHLPLNTYIYEINKINNILISTRKSEIGSRFILLFGFLFIFVFIFIIFLFV